jgi:glycosyltransferase involved in cell wall biosynthesis
MNIGIIRDTEFTNEPRGLNIARILIKNGFNVFVLCYGGVNEVMHHEGIVLVRFYLPRIIRQKFARLAAILPLYPYIWTIKIKKFIKHYQIDVLQVHDLYMLGAALSANRAFQLPVIANFHENYPAAIKTYKWANTNLGRLLTRPAKWAKLEKKYLKKVKHVIVTCTEYKNLLLKKYNFLTENDITVYMNVPDLGEFDAYPIDPSVKGNHDYIIFYFGINAERRGLFIALEALKLVIDKIKKIRLLLIGPLDKDDRTRFHAYLNDPVLDDHITFYPWKDIQYIPSYISASQICISPLLDNEHHNTTIANKVFQYMLFEKPMILSDCLPQRRIIEETESGLLHKADDPRDLADKILYLYHNPDLGRQMGKKGKQAILTTYNTQAQAKYIVQLYKKIKSEFKMGKIHD